jgi:hypothetical protein
MKTTDCRFIDNTHWSDRVPVIFLLKEDVVRLILAGIDDDSLTADNMRELLNTLEKIGQ